MTTDIDNQRLAAINDKKEMEEKFESMITKEREHRREDNRMWQARMDELTEQYKQLVNATGSVAQLRQELRQEMKDERAAYLRSQRRSEDYFLLQLTSMQSVLNSHVKSTSAAITSLSQSINDIRARLHSMGDQIADYLQSQAHYVRYSNSDFTGNISNNSQYQGL